MISFKTYLLEKKDHLIDQLYNLTPDQKKELKAFFAKKPNLENIVDWNNKSLVWSDFKEALATTKTERRRAVKRHGIKGLKEEVDYVELVSPKGIPFIAYIPLNWEASKLIASKKIGGIEGRWCTAYQKERNHWDKLHKGNRFLIYIVGHDFKSAAVVDCSTLYIWSVFDKDDISGYTLRELADIEIVIKKNKELITKSIPLIEWDEEKLWIIKDLAASTILISSDSVFRQDRRVDYPSVYWESGTWRQGIWKGGEWNNGHWESGTWDQGIWMNGTWESGTWRQGIWNDGDWFDGIWKDGVWNKGIWRDGTWESGTWKGGTWKGGTWKGGFDKNGKWHYRSDPPNKWSL